MSSITRANGTTTIAIDAGHEVRVYSYRASDEVGLRLVETLHGEVFTDLSRREALALGEAILHALGEENDLDEYLAPGLEAGDVVQDDSGQIGVVTSRSSSPSATWVLWRRTGFGTFSAQPALAVGRLRLVAPQGVPDPSTPGRPSADPST